MKPVQFYGRLWFRYARPKPDVSPAPSKRTVNGSWQTPARRTISLVGPDEFLFLGERGALSNIGWDGTDREKLWRYNQHYFDDLNAISAKSRYNWHPALLNDWVKNNPAGSGNGWEPYPTSLRIVNWVKWAFAGNGLTAECHLSLAIQTRWLTKRLEYHLLGNHLFSNAKALIFAGLYFKGSEADQWLAKGLKILGNEISEQILPDGGHFERSTMYHALALEDILDLINVFQSYPGALNKLQLEITTNLPHLATKMHRWLQVMSHPDGEISFFNDAAFGIAPANTEIDDYAKRMGHPDEQNLNDLEWLESSGYARLEKGHAVAFLDMAPVGPDHLPGHAHADTLSFELSLFGQRVLVNSGTSCYGTSDERLRQRGTLAHNTVAINHQNSSEVWSGFRVARRAKPISPQVQSGDVLSAQCAHSGYQRLPGSPQHHRGWTLANGQMIIIDEVRGYHKNTEARFYFHPDVELSTGKNASKGVGELSNGKTFRWEVVRGNAIIEPATWHPSFGTSIENRCLVLKLEQGSCQLNLNWAST